ncbi:MAG: amidase domain-containing protein [Bacillota bacterium]
MGTRRTIVHILVLCLLLSVTAWTSLASEASSEAKRIVVEFAAGKGIQPGTDQYVIFLKDILWGVYPELEQHPKRELIRTYAASNLNKEAASLAEGSEASRPKSPREAEPVGWTYNRQAAVDYAYTWAQNGGRKRNPSFPDFAGNDCTNFVSQAVQAGGVPMAGTGGCGSESNNQEWYVKTSAWWCFTNKWAWSTGWSVVQDFWFYHTQHKQHATSTEYTFDQIAQLRQAAQPGDILQLQNASGGHKWHSMVVTKKENGEIYLTYHSGPNDKDVVDKALGQFARADYDYWLISFVGGN